MYNYAVSAVFIGQLLVMYVPFLQSIFQTQALEVSDITYVFFMASIVFWVDEVRKIIQGVGMNQINLSLFILFNRVRNGENGQYRPV